MGFLTRSDILEADDKRYDEVECPEWGGTVRLASISGRQRDAYEGSLIETNGADRKMNFVNARAKLIILTAVDEGGAKLFTADDLRSLGAKNAAPLDRLFDAAKKLIGMSDNDVKRLTEDFGAAQSEEPDSV